MARRTSTMRLPPLAGRIWVRRMRRYSSAIRAVAGQSKINEWILADTPGAEEEGAQKVASLRHSYKLTADSEARLAAVEAEIAKRRGPS